VEPPNKIIRKFEYIYGSLDTKLYGEDIAELLKLEIKTNKLFKQLQRPDRLSLDIGFNKKYKEKNAESVTTHSQQISSGSGSASADESPCIRHVAQLQEEINEQVQSV
jgi:hypothetical protein